MLNLSVITGPVSVILLVAGVLALAYLLFGRDRRWWTRQVPIAVGVGVFVAAASKFVVDVLWQPFPDGFSWLATVWIGLTGMGAALALQRSGRGVRKVISTATVLLVALSGLAQVNQHFGSLPTVRAVLGVPLPGEIDFATVPGPADQLVVAPAGQSIAQNWSPPADQPAMGVTTKVPIPGTTSGFPARSAWIYLPPAYLSTPRAQLPVLVLTSGQPGTPRDWFDGGDLATLMNGFAAAHDGLAPVVVSVDTLGSTLANPLCVDSPRGNSFTYLTVDVPAWIRANLQVAPDPRQWAIGGNSAGGTCSLQLAVNAPAVYPSFIDISGEAEPNLSTRQHTIDKLFGGDENAFRKVNPLDVLAREHFPDSAGIIVAGLNDAVYRPDAKRVFAATQAAGMAMTLLELPGDHSWKVWKPGLAQSLPWLATRTGLT